MDYSVVMHAAVVNPVSEQYRLPGRVTDPYGHDWEIGKPLQ